MTHTLRTADGRTLAHDTLGEGPPLLCHPGGPGMSGAYFEDLGGLDRERTIVHLHPRGTGGSDAPADPDSYTLEALADDVDAVHRELGLDRSTSSVVPPTVSSRSLTPPMLAVSGELDPSGGAAAGRELAEHIPNARLSVLEGSGHFPWIEAPERFRAEVARFLDG